MKGIVIYLQILKKTLKSFLLVFSFLLFLAIIPYIISPVYEFSQPSVFSGEKLYNPYSDIKAGNWFKVNLHSHSYCYWGLTDGYQSSCGEISEVYGKMGYDIAGVSNYMRIDSNKSDSMDDIPVYEHGFGFWKNHYLVIGKENVNYFDFVFYPTLNNKQFLINIIKNSDNIISIVHPWMRNAVSLRDVQFLDNYDCIEVSRYNKLSVDYVDNALSSGKNIKMIANDDSHDISNQDEVGKSLMFINSKSTSCQDIVNSIKKGNVVSVNLIKCGFNSFEVKNQRIPFLPKLIEFQVVNDSLFLKFDSVASVIKFIGQNGVIKSEFANSDNACYYFSKEDTYIRAEVTFPNNAIYLLNPVFRYDVLPDNGSKNEINYPLTVSSYMLWLIAGIFFVYNFRKIKKNKISNLNK